MKRKLLAVGIILLFVGTCIIPAIAQDTEKPLPTSRGNWLYVGGSGPGNYTKIQDAINHASDGDTVFIYDDSSPYNENISIRKSITLMGEDKNTTIIEWISLLLYGIINIIHNDVTVSGFTIQQTDFKHQGSGIVIQGNDCTIEGNIIQNNHDGITTRDGVRNHRICNNIIQNNSASGIYGMGGKTGIYYSGLKNTTISGNYIAENDVGIFLSYACSNKILYNLITDNHGSGIDIIGILNNITTNTVQNHRKGIFQASGVLIIGINNSITKNNLLNNFIQARQEESGNFSEILNLRKEDNTWDSNYWGKPLMKPKRIFGHIYFYDWTVKFWPLFLLWIPWLTYDYHPAQEPYDIGG
jgi:parallel beta-helix repeat protein